MKQINQVIRKHTAFRGLIDITKSARHPYRPSLACASASTKRERMELTRIANAYDAMMTRIGDARRAFRF